MHRVFIGMYFPIFMTPSELKIPELKKRWYQTVSLYNTSSNAPSEMVSEGIFYFIREQYANNRYPYTLEYITQCFRDWDELIHPKPDDYTLVMETSLWFQGIGLPQSRHHKPLGAIMAKNACLLLGGSKEVATEIEELVRRQYIGSLPEPIRQNPNPSLPLN